MIYEEEKCLVNLIKTNIFNKIKKYNIIMLLDNTSPLNYQNEKHFYNILNLLDKFILFTINSDMYFYIEKDDFYLINDIINVEYHNFTNYYLKLNNIYDKISLKNYNILLMYIYNISVDEFGINNMNQLSNYIYNIVDNMYIYMILLSNDIKKIYNHYFNHKNITIIEYDKLEEYDGNYIYIFNNII